MSSAKDVYVVGTAVVASALTVYLVGKPRPAVTPLEAAVTVASNLLGAAWYLKKTR